MAEENKDPGGVSIPSDSEDSSDEADYYTPDEDFSDYDKNADKVDDNALPSHHLVPASAARVLVEGAVVIDQIKNITVPTFTIPPSPQSVDLTQTATFTCSATGDDVQYQWTIASGSFPSKVTGINTNTLVVPDVRSSDDNTYSCTISNDGGSVKSDLVKLTVTGLPILIVLPSSQSVEIMQSAKFSTTVSGIGVEKFIYQWQHNGEKMNGETGDTLNLNHISEKEGGSYQCIVKNQYGDSDLSSAKLVVTGLLPDLAEFNRCIRPTVASKWHDLGVQLKLDVNRLNIIKANHLRDVEQCCTDMYQFWLRSDLQASQEKLTIALQNIGFPTLLERVKNKASLGVTTLRLDTIKHGETDQGYIVEANAVSILSKNVSKLSMNMQFAFDEETWPPNPPKEFMPLLLIHHQDQHTVEQATALELPKAVQLGDVYPKYYQYNDSSKLLKATPHYSTTKKLVDVLYPLQESDKAQFILIEGLPGIGKSVLLQEIACGWGKGQLLQKFKLVLLVQLRNPAVQQVSSIKDILELFCKGYERAKEIVTACSDYLFKNGGKDVVFLFDGFDEFPDDLQKNSLIVDILNREVLPCCGLVVSSRPHASGRLRKKATIIVDILGFSEEERNLYIKQALKETPLEAKKLTEYLASNATIDGLCSIPFNMVVLIHLYKQGIPFPNNSTELYSYFICLTFCRHLAKSGLSLEESNITDLSNFQEPYNTIIKQLSKLSFEALNNHKLIFTFDEVKATCPAITSTAGAINGFGLLQAVQHFALTKRVMTFNFVHFSIQEFLAAYHVTQVPPCEELKILKTKFWSDIHSNMFAMYISLTKASQLAFKEFLSGGSSIVTISKIFLKEQIKCLRLFRYFYEAGEEGICNTIQEAEVFDNKTITLASGFNRLPPYDLECITMFLTQSQHKEWEKLNLPYCLIQDYGLHVLHRGLVGSDITIKELNLRFNGLTRLSSSLISDLTIHCRVEVLAISHNYTVGEDCALYEMLTHPSSRLIKLHMFDTSLSTSNAIFLLTAIMRVNQMQLLHIDFNRITDDACDVITAGIKENTSLVELWMWGNNISGEAAVRLMQALCFNNTLENLWLPYYPQNIADKIMSLQKGIERDRLCRGCQRKIEVIIYNC